MTNAKRDNVPMGVVLQKVYVRGQITFVPHYTKKDYFVAPGGAEYHRTDLILLGAMPGELYLWER